MSCHHCLSRREFLANASGLVVLTTAAACGDGEISGVPASGTPPTVERTVIRVGGFPGLATVGMLVAVTSLIAVKRTGPSSFDAFHMACTHAGCPTTVVNGQRFDCPCHFSRFDSNGAVINGPATDPLRKLRTSYNAATDELTIN